MLAIYLACTKCRYSGKLALLSMVMAMRRGALMPAASNDVKWSVPAQNLLRLFLVKVAVKRLAHAIN